MKQLAMIVVAVLACVNFAYGYDFEYGNLYYTILSNEDKTVSVTSCSSSLKGDLSIPQSVKDNNTTYTVLEIGENAFKGRTGITSVTMPSSLTKVGGYAFWDCSGLKSVTVSKSVSEMCDNAFRNCENLQRVNISDLSAWVKIKFNSCKSNPLHYAGHLYLANKEIKDLVIPNDVTEIGEEVFCSCTEITSVTISSSVKKIGKYAFDECTGFTSLTIPSSVTEIGIGAFSGCSGITSLAIPSSVTEISSQAFNRCSGITSLTIPSSIKKIGDSAFASCSGLTTLTIPSSVTEIGDSAFKGCSGLTTLTIPSSVTKIGGDAFASCSGLTSLTIPSSITEIDSSTFAYCRGLTTLTIPSSVTKIGNYAFYNCSGLISLIIGDSVSSIDFSAFEGCSGLTTLTIPSSVTEIGHSAFRNCSGLTALTIPSSVTEIGSSAFSGCSGLSSLIIGDSVSSIGYSAFEGCRGLTTLTIPSSVTEIGSDAFEGCNLQYIDCLPANPPSAVDAFDNYDALLIANDTYKNHYPWKYFNTFVADYAPTSASFEVDGLKYDIISINDLTCRLYKISDEKSGDIVVPQTVTYKNREFSVKSIDGIIAKHRTDINSIEIPSSMTISSALLVNSSINKLSLGSNINNKIGYLSNIDEVFIKPEVSEFNFDNLSTANINKLTIEDGEAELSVKKTSDYDKQTELYFGRPMDFTKVSFPAVETISFGTYITSINNGAFKNDTAIRTVISNNLIPPTTDDTFSNETYLDGVLYVPESSINDYAAAPGWKNFWEIKSLDEFNGVSEVRVNDTTSFSVSDGALHIVGDAPVRVIAINGAVVYSGKGDNDINLNKGMYIVVIGDKASKIVVR